MKLNIGENIRKNRTRLGWTQTQLAERLGTSVQSVSRWESGGGYPDMELLPELARAFAVSVDELIGYGEPECKSDVEELRKNLYSAVHRRNPSAKEAAQVLRQLRLEHPREAVRLASILYYVPPAVLENSPELLRELRLIADVCAQQGYTQYTPRFLRTIAKFEDDEHFREIIKPYCMEPGERLDYHTFLLDRAEAQGDAELFRKVHQVHMVQNLYGFLRDRSMTLAVSRSDGAYDYDSLPPADAHFAAKVSEKKLQLLHTFNGMCAEERYPLSANGIADMWTPVRIRIGRIYAAQLSALGEYERALTVLEDVAVLAEQSCDFPDLSLFVKSFSLAKCPLVPVISPLLPDVGAYRHPILEWKHVSFHFSCSDHRSHGGFMGDVNYRDLVTFLTSRSAEPTDSFRVPWLDPIREHPRYKAVVERIQGCKDRLTNTKEESA